MQKATFAAGCFWGVEDSFSQLPGVISVTSGYTGGNLSNPSYEQVCSGKTGHAEAVEIIFDPEKISYFQLVEHFFAIHDPTLLNRQGPDIGTQYRSVIFFHDEQQKQSALDVIQRMSVRWKNPIVTQVVVADTFWPAEDYHQKWCKKHPH